MHAQQIMGTAGRSQLVSSDFASAMWSSRVWCQFLERHADAPSDRFNSLQHRYLTDCKSKRMRPFMLSQFWLLNPGCSFYRLTLYLSEQQQGGSERLLFNQRAKAQAAVSSLSKNLWSLREISGWLSGFSSWLVWKCDPWCRRSPLEKIIYVLVCCVI